MNPLRALRIAVAAELAVRQSRAVRTRATAVVPGIGGLLVLRQLS